MNYRFIFTGLIILVVLLILLAGLPSVRSLSPRQIEFPVFPQGLGVEVSAVNEGPVATIDFPKDAVDFKTFDQDFVNYELRVLAAELVKNYARTLVNETSTSKIYSFDKSAQKTLNKYRILKGFDKIELTAEGKVNLLKKKGKKLLYDFKNPAFFDKKTVGQLVGKKILREKNNTVNIEVQADQKGFNPGMGLKSLILVFYNKKGLPLKGIEVVLPAAESSKVEARLIQSSDGSSQSASSVSSLTILPVTNSTMPVVKAQTSVSPDSAKMTKVTMSENPVISSNSSAFSSSTSEVSSSSASEGSSISSNDRPCKMELFLNKDYFPLGSKPDAEWRRHYTKDEQIQYDKLEKAYVAAINAKNFEEGDRIWDQMSSLKRTGDEKARYLAREGEKDVYPFTFRDVLGNYDPELLSLEIETRPKDTPWLNHANRRSLVFDSEIAKNRKSATLTTREALWYGVRENSKDYICDWMDRQSIYYVTFKPQFSEAACNITLAQDTFHVNLHTPNASNVSLTKIQILSEYIGKAYIKPYVKNVSPEMCCVWFNLPLTPSPFTATCERKIEGAPKDYKQLYEKTLAEEDWHGEQSCNPNIPWSKGGKLGPGGPLSVDMISNILNKYYPSKEVCEPVGVYNIHNHASKRKAACVKAKESAGLFLRDVLSKLLLIKTSYNISAWVEWTAKLEIGVTEYLRTALHYACAYGGGKYPDNNPPKPNPEKNYVDYMANPAEYIKENIKPFKED